MKLKGSVGAVALLLASCYGQPDAPPAAEVSCEGRPDPHCAHPIDALIVPKLRLAGLEPRDGAPSAICRRMSVDLIGRIPTLPELDRCVAQASNEERADTFMATADYARVQRRAWAETIGFDTYLMWYGDALDLDKLTARFFSGEIDYRTFAANVVIHPAFYAVHQGDDWAANIFNTFLGRTARPDEIAGMRPLTSIFQSRVFCDGALWSQYYDWAIEEGRTPAEATTDANDGCLGAGSEEYVVNFCGCEVGYGAIGCRSTTLGKLIDFGLEGCHDEEAPDLPENYYRIGELTPGRRTSCAAETGPRECKDRLVDDSEQIAGDLVPFQTLEGPLRQRLMSIGEAMAERPDFWEAGADREIARFIGWWKDGVRRPDFDLPEVRAVLAAELRRTGSIRAIQRLLVTSVLYTGEAEPPVMPPGVEPPLWSMGSTKILAAENWLDSAGVATGDRAPGFCDFRFVALGDVGPMNVAPDLVVRGADNPVFDAERYDQGAQALGGCTANQVRPRISSVGMTFAQHDLARSLCATSPGVLPPGFASDDASDPSLQNVVKHIVRRALSRDATPEEIGELVVEMRECLAAPNACTSAEIAARWLCVHIIDSAEFATY